MYVRIRDYAKKKGVHYRTAYRWYKDGKIRGYQMDTATIITTEDEPTQQTQQVTIYARVSSRENLSNLDTQAERLIYYTDYSRANEG